jgi:membrane-associated protein
MDWIRQAIDFVLHVDVYLEQIISQYGGWTYAILFVAASTFAARSVSGEPGSLNPWLMFGLLAFAAVLGDSVNYWIGHRIGKRAYTGEIKWIRKDYMERTHAFFEKHGGKTIFLARFVPIIRTFTPFVAGVSRMSYGFFFRWNVIGGITWVATFTLLGYFFGNIPFVQKNFELVIIAIILISLVPAVVEVIKAKKEMTVKKDTPVE